MRKQRAESPGTTCRITSTCSLITNGHKPTETSHRLAQHHRVSGYLDHDEYEALCIPYDDHEYPPLCQVFILDQRY